MVVIVCQYGQCFDFKGFLKLCLGFGRWVLTKRRCVDNLWTTEEKSMAHPLLNKTVIVRSNPSGCWHGTLQSLDGDTVTLTDARRLWRWWSAIGVSLSGVAAEGLRPSKLDQCHIAVPVAIATVFSVCEILQATEKATASIVGCPVR